MEADFSVELGADDPTLVMPWQSDDGEQKFIDLRRNSERISEIPEARENPALKDFLRLVNSEPSKFMTAKCDVWSTDDLNVEEDIFNARWKHGGYVDLFFADAKLQCDFEQHRKFGENLKTQICLRKADGGHEEPLVSVEILLRRCHLESGFGGDNLREGFYFTLYIFGYGQDLSEARLNWQGSVPLIGRTLVPVSSEFGAAWGA